MGQTLGHLVVMDYHVKERKTKLHLDSIDFGAVGHWEKADRVFPLKPDRTVIRIVQIVGVTAPEAKVFGPSANQITNVQLQLELNRPPEHSFDFSATQFPYAIMFTHDGENVQVFLIDHMSLKATDNALEVNGKVLALVPAGTKLIFDKTTLLMRSANNFYVETPALKFASHLRSCRYIVLEQDTQMVDFTRQSNSPFTETVGYEPISIQQMNHLIQNSQPYSSDQSWQNLEFSELEAEGRQLLALGEKSLIPGMLAFLLNRDPELEHNELVKFFLESGIGD